MNPAVTAQFDAKLLENIRTGYERVYVHLDKMVYVSGGSIRYRAFLTDINSLQEGIKSSILYFELKAPDQDHSILWRVNLTKGNGSGSFVIPSDLKSGTYSLKAFTNRMRNGNPDYIFSTDILIVNIAGENTVEIPVAVNPDNRNVLIDFYPEGRNLIYGIESKVGYMLHGTFNEMLPVSINIMENDSVEMARIIPDASGTGWFYFLPSVGNRYHASLLYENGQIVNVNLPYIDAYGYAMQVTESGRGLAVKIRSENSSVSQVSSLHLIAVSRGSIVLDSVFYSSGGEQTLFIPEKQLNEGIISFNLYDSRRFSLCQRLYYYSSTGPGPGIRIQGLDKVHKQSDTIRLELLAEGLDDGDSASLAVSVSEVQAFHHILNRSNIDRHFAVISEIAGLPVPMHYLNEISDKQISDLLLCVDENDYAWNYSNKNVSSGCLYDSEPNGYILTGTVKNRQSGEPLASADIMITVTDSVTPRIMYTNTDTAGGFRTVLSPFFDNKDIILQVCDGNNNTDLAWELEEKRLQSDARQAVPYILTEAEKELVNRSRDIRIIEAIYESKREERPGEAGIIAGMVFLTPDAVIHPADYTELVNFKEIADNILPSVRFITRNRQYITEIFNRPYEYWLINDKVLLNGVLFKDLAYIATLGSKDIERVEIYNSNLMCGPLTIPGLLSIYTHDGKIPENYLRDHAFTFHNEVAVGDDQTVKNYGVQEETSCNPDDPDFRQTLLWAPDVKMSGSDRIVLEFQTSRLQGLFEINIQGISRSGIPMHANFNFMVE
ncbi:MAG: hypothetical protein JXB19_12175 [Bacteroidales bacterium]|nr:hypothetical protein [Bacteroidales bacterium]